MTIVRDRVDVSNLLTVPEFQAAAKERLTPGAYVYVAGGAGDERTMRDNIDAFARWRFVPRVLVDTSGRSLAASPCLYSAWASVYTTKSRLKQRDSIALLRRY